MPNNKTFLKATYNFEYFSLSRRAFLPCTSRTSC